MAQYVRGDSVRVEADFWDPTTTAETAVTPSTITISIFDPVGNQIVSEASMTLSGTTGTYYYEYQSTVTSLVGIYNYRCSGVVSSKTGRKKGSFELSKETDV